MAFKRSSVRSRSAPPNVGFREGCRTVFPAMIKASAEKLNAFFQDSRGFFTLKSHMIRAGHDQESKRKKI